MPRNTLLFIDNDQDLRGTWSEFLAEAGYRVLQAGGPGEARELLAGDKIDLAIIDVRLTDDRDDCDVSGLTLAKNLAPTLPKIVLTRYPTAELAVEALAAQVGGLPPAVKFISKLKGPENLIQAVNYALENDRRWLLRVQSALKGTDEELKKDYTSAFWQSIVIFIASLIVVLAGAVIIFRGIVLTLDGQIPVGVASTVAGLVTEAVSYLFFRRVDAANRRMDCYHQERFQGQRFETLLQACDGIRSDLRREKCREQVILSAAGRWLGGCSHSQVISQAAQPDGQAAE